MRSHSKINKHFVLLCIFFFLLRWKNKMNMDSLYTTQHPTPLHGCVCLSSSLQGLSHTQRLSSAGQTLPSLQGAHTRLHREASDTGRCFCNSSLKWAQERFLKMWLQEVRRKWEKYRDRAGAVEEEPLGIHLLCHLLELEWDSHIRTMKVHFCTIDFCIVIQIFLVNTSLPDTWLGKKTNSGYELGDGHILLKSTVINDIK